MWLCVIVSPVTKNAVMPACPPKPGWVLMLLSTLLLIAFPVQTPSTPAGYRACAPPSPM